MNLDNLKVYYEVTSDQVLAALDKYNLRAHVVIEDLPTDRWWRNDESTLVFSMPNDLSFNVGLRLCEFANTLHCDEFNWVIIDDRIYIRMWWD